MPRRYEIAVNDRFAALVWELPDEVPDEGIEVELPHAGHAEGTCVECDAYRLLLNHGRYMTIPELRERFGAQRPR